MLRVMDRLGSFQFDPLEVAGRNHDLLLLARIAGYRRAWTDAHLYETRSLYETYNKGLSLVPTAELPWYRITWDLNHDEHTGGAFDEHAPLVEELLERIRRDGPLSSTDIEPRAAIDWYWRPTNQVRALLEALAEAGILGLSRREGNRRVYDLVERLFPAELLAERHPQEEQRRHKLLSRYRAHGLLGTGGEATVWLGTGLGVDRPRRRGELVDAGDIVPVGVDGLRGTRFVVASDLDDLDAAEREVAAGVRPEAWTRAWRSLPHSIRSSGIATCCAGCGASTTCGRCTSRRRNGVGATTCCRCCMATASSAGSSRASTGRPTRCASSGCGGRTASTRWPIPGSDRRLSRRSGRIATSAVSAGSPGRGWSGSARSCRPCAISSDRAPGRGRA